MAITHEQLTEAADYLRGTPKSADDAIEALELDIDDGELSSQLLDVDLELCGHCDWWHEVHELQHHPADECGYCDQCREELGIEDE